MAMDEFTAVMRARAFVNKVSPTMIPVPIQPYLDQLGAVLRLADDLSADEAGYTVEIKGKRYIYVNGNDSDERQRYTACHEAAHIELGLPTEHVELPSWSYAKRSPNEILCDVFAAELLLPYRLFKPLVDKAGISLALIDDLGRRFLASGMATGSRFAALTRAPCAFVLAERGKVRYASRSTALREANAWIPPRAVLPDGSLSARVRAGAASGGPEEVVADIWFDNWGRGGTLLEDARHLAAWDQTVALLWLDDEEALAWPRDRKNHAEEEFGLAELDGILPWPGRMKRR
jgi:IrrE N-terminal-like domain